MLSFAAITAISSIFAALIVNLPGLFYERIQQINNQLAWSIPFNIPLALVGTFILQNR